MFYIIELKHSQRKTHIAKNESGRRTLCGKDLTREQLKNIFKGNAELCSCGRCLVVLDNNPDLFTE